MTVALAALAALPTGLFSAPPFLTAGSSSSGVVTPPSGMAGGLVAVAPGLTPSPAIRPVGPLAPNSSMEVVVGLAPRDPAGLNAYLALVETPGSPGFRQFLSPVAVTDRFGPAASDYDHAAAYFRSTGLTVTTSPDRLLLRVDGTVTNMETAFRTSFANYQEGGRLFFSHPTPATLPAGIPWSGVLGLGNQTALRPSVAGSIRSVLALPAAGCPTSVPFTPCEVQTGYNLTGLLTSGTTGTGYRIGVVDTYDGAEPQPQLQSDLASFAAANGIPVGAVNYLYPVPTSRDLNLTRNGWGLEEALDLEWSRAMAPGATIDMTFAPDASSGLYYAIDWLVAHHAVDVISLSWGEPDVGVFNASTTPCSTACNASTDGSYTLLRPVLAAAAAEGIGVFAASADCGAADGTNGVSTSYPASDPSATGVGGTVLTLGPANAYGSETAWSGNRSGSPAPGCENQGGSGGGYAPLPRPWWQTGPGLPSSNSQRGVPDVAMDAGTPVQIVWSGQTVGVLGTSAATPMWAALEAIADQKAGQPLGNVDPSLYALARGPNYATLFHDITSGSNGYPAGPHWDPVTGLGSPNAATLVPALSGGALPPPLFYTNLYATPRVVGVGASVAFFVNATGGHAPYGPIDVAFGDGTAAFAVAGNTSHSFASAGVYAAIAVAFDSQGNSSVSSPVAIVVGGGGSLRVSLSGAPSAPAVGQTVSFTTTVVGGVGVLHYRYEYGDGTYLVNSTAATVSHAYGVSGGFCAAVTVFDSATPPNGGVSNPFPVTVGGASGPSCRPTSPLSATLTSAYTAADVPADFPLLTTVSGGSGPVAVQYVSDDPYVAACHCGIFRTVGTHVVTAYVNDSVNQNVIATLSVTTYPALAAQFRASVADGPAPLTVTFQAAASGGHGANVAQTNWSYGDGTFAFGATVTHIYATPGTFVAIGSLEDQGHGNASEAFAIAVLSGSLPLAPVLVANVTPAVRGYAGALVHLRATVLGGTGSSTVYWNLGAGDSAFGPSVDESYAQSGCVGAGTCALTMTVSATDAAGRSTSVTFTFQPFLSVRASALVLSDAVAPLAGSTPLLVRGSAVASGMPGPQVAWAFGDGGLASGGSVSHVYRAPGNYTVLESATDASGDLFLRSHGVRVVGSTIAPLSISAHATPSSGVVPLHVQFNASASGGAGSPYGFSWSFGDGTSLTGARVNHTYPATGRFVANATATDSLGEVANATMLIGAYSVTAVTVTLSLGAVAVGNLPVAARIVVACSASSVPGCSPQQVLLNMSFETMGGSAPVSGSAPPPIGFPASGFANFTLAAPGPGAYDLVAVAAGPNYAGSAKVPFTVTGGNLFSYVAPATLVLGLALVVGAVSGAVAGAVSLRRRRSPNP